MLSAHFHATCRTDSAKENAYRSDNTSSAGFTPLQEAAAQALSYSSPSLPLSGFVFQIIFRHILHTSGRYSGGKL